MRPIIISLFLTITSLLSAQTFTNIESTLSLEGVWHSSVAFADVNGDGYEDALIAGMDASMAGVANLYLNDGTGSFTVTSATTFEGIFNSSIAFSDIDNDGDQDVIISGSNNSIGRITKLYTNNGSGHFTLNTASKLEAIEYSAIAFSDIDNDGDDDLLTTGRNDEREQIANLYTNDGKGKFTKVLNTQFEGVESGTIEFTDIDNDGDNDVLITGRNQKEIPTSKLYTNDGAGSFTLTAKTFEQVEQSSIEFADLDNDGDQDLVITGLNELYEPTTKLYTNDGLGNFSEKTNTTVAGVYDSSIAVADFDNDGDNDLLIAGSNGEKHITKLYTNDGAGNFNEDNNTDYLGVFCGAIAASDFDNDGYNDILITGLNNKQKPIAELYINNPAFNADYVAENVLDTDKTKEVLDNEAIMFDGFNSSNNETPESIEVDTNENIAKQQLK